MRKDGGRGAESMRMHRARDSGGSSWGDVLTRNSDQDSSHRSLSRNVLRHRSRSQQGPISSLEDNLDDSSEYWHFDTDDSEEVCLFIDITINSVNNPTVSVMYL
jgi:hypothetical protein